MKKVLAVVAAVGCLSATYALAGIPAASGVNGSLHDMTVVAPSTADSMGRVCVYCHTPHHAVVKAADEQLPLWNHTIPTVAFTPYVWATNANRGEENVFDIGDPLKGPSRLCMSCHDGAIAVDQHGEAFAGAGSNIISAVGRTFDGENRANLTNDLSNTHPIGFDYNAIATWRNGRAANGSPSADNASEIVPSTFEFASGYTVSNTQGTYNTVERNSGKPIVDTLFEGKWMTCATCHEVHNKENATQRDYTGTRTSYPDGLEGEGTQSAPNYFLYAQQWQSLICLSCHVK